MSPLERFIPRFQLTRPSEAEIAGERDRRAAVLLPITNKARPGILLTQRAVSLRSHPGQKSAFRHRPCRYWDKWHRWTV